MKIVYLATVIAIIITTSIASRVLALRALGPVAPGLLASLRSAARGLISQIGNFVDDRIAAALAYRERQVAFFMLRHFSDRQLRDIGLHRGNIGHDPRFFEPERQARSSEMASACAAVNERPS